MTAGGICYLVGAGDFFGNISAAQGDFIIAADGGYESLLARGVLPDLLLGDFDSIKEMPSGIETVRYPVEKDETDMFLAYKIGVSLGYKKFRIYGGVGGREDHTFANYSLLLQAKRDENDAVLIGNGVEIKVIENEKTEIFGASGKCVSVFAIASDAEGVNIKGLKYEAENITLGCAFPLGVSNSFTDAGRGEISVARGALLIFTEV